MVFVTGDIHGSIDISKLNTKQFPIQKQLTKKDIVIICGDFGNVWYLLDSDKAKTDKYWIKWLNTRNFTTLFVDGNHENFELLNSYPVSVFKCGKVHQISDSVYHLMRGEIYEIEGHSFFCFGGASSHDKECRIQGVSWWPEELPSVREMDRGLYKLEGKGSYVDFVITHCAANSIQSKISDYFQTDCLTNYFEHLENNIMFKHWFFGHYHVDMDVDEKHTCLYNRVIRIL